jgi:hypothetical protein
MPEPLAKVGNFFGHGDPKREFSVRKEKKGKGEKREKKRSKIPASSHTTDRRSP